MVVLAGALALLAVVARVGAGAIVRFVPPDVVPRIDLNPINLPYYVAHSTLRMFIALGCSFLFTFVYGHAAAHSRRAELILIPLLDIMQVEVPSSMIGLIWNATMSFGGGWFFIAASETISVLNQHYTLPGIGSYVAAAVNAQNLGALGWAVLTMALVKPSSSSIPSTSTFRWRRPSGSLPPR